MEQIIPYAMWDIEDLETHLWELIGLHPENEGIWLNEDLFWACVFILGLPHVEDSGLDVDGNSYSYVYFES